MTVSLFSSAAIHFQAENWRRIVAESEPRYPNATVEVSQVLDSTKFLKTAQNDIRSKLSRLNKALQNS